jgi:hypothetical protein
MPQVLYFLLKEFAHFRIKFMGEGWGSELMEYRMMDN